LERYRTEAARLGLDVSVWIKRILSRELDNR
jgi:hypothetical protein